MGLFGGKTALEVELAAATVVAGDVVRVRASFGAPDRKTQGGRVELVYRNTYKHDTSDGEHGSSTSTTTSDVVVATGHVALTDTGLATPVEVALTIPSDAPGTSAKAVAWEVRAIADRRHGRDARAMAPLTVLTPAGQQAAWAQAPLEVSVSWPMRIEPSTRMVRAGERITGHFSFTPGETIKADAVRVQLRRLRRDPDGNSDSDDGTRVQLLAKSEFQAGVPQSLPFEIAVPQDAPPSFVARHNRQHWYLEGVIDVPRAKDPRVTAEIVVHTG